MKLTLIALILSPLAAVAIERPLHWTADIARVTPMQFDAMHGDALAFNVDFNASGKPVDLTGLDATLYWQTNGMESAWWSATGTVSNSTARALFPTAADPGSKTLNFFLGLTDGSNVVYGASARVTFRNSPGATPNTIAPPVVTLDFATIDVLHAPWATPDDLAAAADELHGAIADVAAAKADVQKNIVTTRWRFDPSGLILDSSGDDIWAADDANYMQYVADRGVYRWTLAGYGAGLCYGGADAAALTNATGAAYTFTRLSATNQYDVAYMDDVAAAVAPLCTIEAAEAMRAAESNRVDSLLGDYLPRTTSAITAAGVTTDYLINSSYAGGIRVRYSSSSLNNYTSYGYRGVTARRNNVGEDWLWDATDANGIVRRKELAGITTEETDPTVPSWAKAASKPAYTAAEVGAATPAQVAEVSADNAQTRQIVTTWENFLDGSNVVFSITNYLSGTYSLDAAKLRILELREGTYQEVFNSRDEILLHIENFRTNDFRVATNQVIGAVNAAIGNKADRDWGKYTSAGGEAPANTVYMTAPNTVFAGGLEYERVAVGEGAVCVLTTRGAPVWTQGDEGTFKFQDDGGTNYFGFAKTDSYTIGANTDGITVQGGMVTMQYNITMSGRPCVWYKSSLSSGAWEQLNLPDGSPVAGASHAVTWEANPPANSQVCYINVGNQPQGFFRATVEVAGEAKFMTNMPADLSGGIICPNTATGVNGVIKPSFNGSSVIWTWSAN